jgi:hypothetical protein
VFDFPDAIGGPRVSSLQGASLRRGHNSFSLMETFTAHRSGKQRDTQLPAAVVVNGG